MAKTLKGRLTTKLKNNRRRRLMWASQQSSLTLKVLAKLHLTQRICSRIYSRPFSGGLALGTVLLAEFVKPRPTGRLRMNVPMHLLI